VGLLQRGLRPRLWPLYLLAIAVFLWARPSPVSLLFGALLAASGEGLRVWATGHLHKTDSLTVTGPYAFLRHPLYLGTLLVVSGFGVMAGSWVSLGGLAAFLLFFFGYYMPYKNRIEGARLERLYGDAFRRYAVVVPSLLPRLSPYRPLGDERPASASWRPERFAENHELGTAAAVALGVVAMVTRWALA
jgi:protein-S-isoprenylcysteine O-methyltransferase Ste14